MREKYAPSLFHSMGFRIIGIVVGFIVIFSILLTVYTIKKFETLSDPKQPDYYFKPGHRYVSITAPLFTEKREYGSINVKLSLSFLDTKLKFIYTYGNL